jgi:hypothetical protein
MWNPATNDVRAVPVTAAVPPAPVPVPQPMPQPVAQPAAAPAYGVLDPALAAQEEQNPGVFGTRERNLIYLDWAPLAKEVGAESALIVRLLPPWGQQRLAHAKAARHCIPAEVIPDAPADRKMYFIDCLDSQGGPKDCPIDAALRGVLDAGGDAGWVDQAKPKAAYYWQAVNLNEPTKHYVQLTDANGQPVANPDGTPAYKIVPGVIRMGSTCHKEILKYIREKGDPTHPDHGYPMKLAKRRTGSGRYDVEYTAIDLQAAPLHDALRPVLANLLDLQATCIDFKPKAELAEIGQRILQKHGLGGPQPMVGGPVAAPAQWTAHPSQPGWEYNSLGQMRPVAAPPVAPPMPAAPPMAPPMAPPPAAPMAAPPPMPMAPPMPPPQPPAQAAPPAPPPMVAPPAPPPQAPAQAAPPPPPGNLPPPVAPGGLPAAPAAPGMPPMPPPPPGIPPGVAGPPAAPPLPPGNGQAPPPPPTAPAVPGQAQTPEQFEAEASGAATNQGKLPF